MTTVVAKDLTKEFPRSPYEELAGFPWLARVIDKVRALKAGTLGEYTAFPCGGDKRFLALTGLDADAFKALIDSGADDAAIVAYVKANSKATPEEIDGYRKLQRTALPESSELYGYLQEYKAEIAAAKPGLDLSAGDNFARLICLEEGHPLQ